MSVCPGSVLHGTRPLTRQRRPRHHIEVDGITQPAPARGSAAPRHQSVTAGMTARDTDAVLAAMRFRREEMRN